MNIANRLDKLEARQPGADPMPKLVVTFVCPERGITGARWLDDSTLHRAEGETESAFKHRMAAQSAIVFADPMYGGPGVNLSDDDLRL